MNIKFRAWHKAEKKMYQVVDMYFGESGNLQSVRLLADHNEMRYPTNDVDPKELELMQYTGFFDKNGNEICCGDIVKAYILTHQSHVNKDTPIKMIVNEVTHENGRLLINGLSLDDFRITDMFIVGNIFENKDLLENEEDEDYLYSASYVIEVLGFSRRWLYTLIERGEIQYIKVGRMYKFKKEWINDFINKYVKEK